MAENKAPATTNTVLPKITIKDIGADAKKVLAMDGEKARWPLARIYGVATGTKERIITQDNGDKASYWALKGDFRARVVGGNVRYQSGLLYLPDGIHDLIAEPLEIAKANNETAEVTFALDFFSEKRGNKAGYGYGAIVIGEPEENDAMKRIEAAIADVAAAEVPKLDAPKA